jgi:hypothetical protein
LNKFTRSAARILVAAVAMVAAIAVAPTAAHATNIGEEGCTPGYWKNHTDNWQEYTVDSKIGNNWDLPPSLASFANETFLQALDGGGGPGITGAATILFRASVAAYLNAAHEGVGYPYRRFTDPFNMKLQINNALASEDRDTMLALATTLDNANNLGCPLN